MTHCSRALRFSSLVVAWAAAFLLISCGGADDALSDDAGLLDCQDGDLEAGEQLSALAMSLSACDRDGDCVQVPYELDCPDIGTHVGGCTFALSKAKMSEYQDGARDVAEALCPRLEPGCHSGASCIATEARCVAGTCELDSIEP
jgi:hypothetical protein